MSKSILQSIALFIVLALIQVLVCNNISIFGFATPYVFIYVILRLPVTLHRNWVMLIGFLAGVIIDIFGNTAGMNALACTLLGAMRDPMIKLYVAHDDEISDPVPSAKSLGPGVYLKYMFSMTLLFCLLVTFIEAFTLNNALLSLYRAAGCTALTFVIMLGIDALATAKKD